MSLKNNLIKNGIANTIGKFIRMAEQLILVPFFISAWGAAYYGEWLTLTIIPSMMALSDLGFGTSAANKFLLQYAAGDKQSAANTARSGLFIISIVVGLGIFLSIALLVALDYFQLFDKSLIKREDAIWSVLFLMIARLIGFYGQIYEAYFRAIRKAALSINMQSIYSAANISVGLFVLILNQGVIVFAFTNLLLALIFNLFYFWYAKKQLSLFNTHKGKIIKSEIKSIASHGFGYLLSPIWQALYFQGTTFIVRMILGPLAVTTFNTVRTITRSVNQTFSLVNASIFPEFQFEVGAGNLDKARSLFRFGFLLVITLAILGIIFLFLFGSWFYEIWTKNTLNPPAGMWYIFIIGIGFNAVWWSSAIIFQAYNKPYNFTIAGSIAAIISIISTYYLSKSFGLTGAAMSSLILEFLLAFYILPTSCKLLKQPMVGLFKDMSLMRILVVNKINKHL